MNWPDLINGLFEMFGGVFALLSVFRLHRDKVVRGLSLTGVAFFVVWSYWNLFYYPHLNQWLSFYGTLGLVAVNTFWFGQIVHYTLAEQRLTRRNSGRII